MRYRFALFFLTVAAFAQTNTPVFKQGDDPLPIRCTQCNSPAAIALTRDESDWQGALFSNLSFLYYYAKEEGLNLANSGQVVNPSGATFLATSAITNGKILAQEFEYKPAFKIGIGTYYRDWKIGAEYTWIRQTTYVDSDAPSPTPNDVGVGIWIINGWLIQTNSNSGQSLAGTNLQSSWDLALDIADLKAGRPYYLGERVVISPSYGLRGAWIRQKLDLDLTTASLLTGGTPVFVHSSNRSSSWGVGPAAGVESSTLLGKGFRFEAGGTVAILYTVYTKNSHKENGATGSLPADIGVKQNGVIALRPEMELDLGIGWGSYLQNGRYHIDLTAKYDFLVFWNYNVLRHLLDETNTGVSTSPNNLYLEGVEASLRFDF